METIEVKNLKKYFPLKKFGGKHYVRAVDDVSFSIKEGEVVGILGESGCGKSTLGFLIARLEKETQGDIFFKGQKISGTLHLSQDERRQIQLILQNPYDSFDPRVTIGESLLIPLRIHKIGSNDSERQRKIYEYMETAGLLPSTNYYNRYPHELSGGQLQRLSILRAMLLNPDFLIADECVSMLDVSVRADVINFLLKFVSLSKTSMMFITHDISLGSFVSNRIIVMYLGKVVEIARTDEIVKNPLHPYTRVLLSYSPSLVEKRKKIQIAKIYTQPLLEKTKGCNFFARCPFAQKECLEVEPELVKVNEDHFVACNLIK